MDNDLLHFLVPTEEKLRILTLESSHYLPELHRLMPRAELYAVTAEADEPEEPAYAGLAQRGRSLIFAGSGCRMRRSFLITSWPIVISKRWWNRRTSRPAWGIS